ncbi:MAG: 3'(2'),5'-bisphosphate nucleotidase CysQ [Octadecabacter sp.]
MQATDLELLIDAARAAGEIATVHFNASPDVWDKPDGAGPVTEADLAVDAMLRATLCAQRPDYGWLSEETEDSPARLSTDHQFIVDPIDGTRAFIEKSKDWSHSMAVTHHGEVTAAVIYLPLRDMLFAAQKGGGATLNGAPITTSKVTALDGGTVLAARSNMESQNWRAGVPPVKRHFRSSLAYRMALVANGQFDAMLTLRPTWEWDIAAGTLIVTEAGGGATTRKGAPLWYNNPHPQLDGIVAGGGLHAPLLAALA